MIGAEILLALAIAAPTRAEEIPGKPPDPSAEALKAFAWRSLNGLRFVWWLPKGYDPQSPRNLTVIVHSVRVDYRWGYDNQKPGLFRPDDVVLSVDGPMPDGENRLFSRDKKDADAIAAFLSEMRRSFAVDRVFLYGYGQGGLFALNFAGDHPDLVAGVVAHATGDWNGFGPGADPKKVAIALLQGTSDADAPFALILDRRDAYAKLGCPLLLLRRLDRCGHEPNPARASETLAWCQGMTATKPAEALACALELLRSKSSDVQDRETKVGFSGARDVLRRLEKKGEAPFADVPDDVAEKAKEWTRKVEDAGAAHVAAIRASLKGKKTPKLDGGAWLGHLVPLREDFRGVDSVEAFMRDIGFDAQAQAHAKAAAAMIAVWSKEKDVKKRYEAVVDGIGKSFLYDAFPLDLDEKMTEWNRDAKKYALPVLATKKYPDFEAWEKGWKDGLEAYVGLCKEWTGP